ncbi:MAG: BlaI/MecI/CopY family transcriptional regulator [Rhodanobacteraceae bacterium]|nr:BlaI/MecI/CopY family transcriptional regulator [Rhodanobacteraceae bacterium]
MTMSSEDTSLSELQLELMRVLWARGEASTADVAEVLANSRGLAHTTIATLLSRLEKRGVVASRRDGRQLVYRALVAQGEVQRSMVSGLLDNLFGGDARALLAHLVREEEIAPGDLDRVRELLAGGRGDD